MKASKNPVSLHIFVSVSISIRAHVYINSYIHELLIVLTEWLFVRARTDRILAIRTAHDHETI